MNRIDAIIELDTAIAKIEKVRDQLVDIVYAYSLDRRIDNLIEDLESLRVDILQADLPGERD